MNSYHISSFASYGFLSVYLPVYSRFYRSLHCFIKYQYLYPMFFKGLALL